MCDVESHPFDLDTMLFMDWRDDHTKGDERMRTSNQVSCPPIFCRRLAASCHRLTTASRIGLMRRRPSSSAGGGAVDHGGAGPSWCGS